jgi:hypothetical protein
MEVRRYKRNDAKDGMHFAFPALATQIPIRSVPDDLKMIIESKNSIKLVGVYSPDVIKFPHNI